MSAHPRGKLGAIELAALGLAFVCLVATTIEFSWPHAMTFDEAVTVEPDGLPEGERVLANASSAPDYRVIAERPLFTVNRKPYVVPSEEPPSPPPVVRRERRPEPEMSFELSAVIRTSGAEIALLTVSGRPESHKLRPGEELEGWVLSEVRPDSVRMERNGREMLVPLKPEEDTTR